MTEKINTTIEIEIPISSSELMEMEDVEINALIDDKFKAEYPYYHEIGYNRTGYSVKYHINQNDLFDGIVLKNVIIPKMATLKAIFTLR